MILRHGRSIMRVIFLLLLSLSLVEGKGTIHKCVHSSNKVAKNGNGTTIESCMGCNPAISTCHSGCQQLINNLYIYCDSICLPYGYYFDPQWQLSGCWDENKPDIKIKTERCGCSAASRQQLGGGSFNSLIYLVFIVSSSLLCVYIL